MITQYLLKWSCRYCGKPHEWWRDLIDIPTEQHDVNCMRCKLPHKLRVFTNQLSENAYCEITTVMQNQTDLQHFIEFEMPTIPNRYIITRQIEHHSEGITADEAIQIWCEHDAMHYLAQKPFTHEGEEYIAYLERRFNCGFYPRGEHRNLFYPRKFYCSHITRDLIMETAELIKEYID
jgi:hypothetical protein